jgi:hypothetical protein
MNGRVSARFPAWASAKPQSADECIDIGFIPSGQVAFPAIGMQ